MTGQLLRSISSNNREKNRRMKSKHHVPYPVLTFFPQNIDDPFLIPPKTTKCRMSRDDCY